MYFCRSVCIFVLVCAGQFVGAFVSAANLSVDDGLALQADRAVHNQNWNEALGIWERMAGSTENKWFEKANLNLGDFYFKQGSYYGSYYFYTRVLENGRDVVDFYKVLGKALSISHYIDSYETLAAVLKQIPTTGMNIGLRARKYYIVGKQAFKEGQFAACDTWLAKVPTNHSLYAAATMMRGISAVKQKKYDVAIGFFQLVKDLYQKKIRDPLYENAALNLARSYFGKGDLEKSRDAYMAIPKISVQWFAAQYELSWVLFQMNQFNQSLGIGHTFLTRFTDHLFYPESFYVRLLNLFYLCKNIEISKMAKLFAQKYLKLKQQLTRLDLRYKNNKREATKEAIVAWNKLADGQKILREDLIFYKTLFKQAKFAQKMRAIHRLIREKEILKDLGLRASIHQEIIAGLQDYENTLSSEVDEVITAELTRQLNILEAVDEQFLLVEVESSAGIIQSGSVPKAADSWKQSLELQVAVRPGYEYWPYLGEKWRDELGGYYYFSPTNCR